MDKVKIAEKLSAYKGLLEKAASTISDLQAKVAEAEVTARAEKIATKMMDKGLIEPSDFLAKRAELIETIKTGSEDPDTLERAVDLAKEGGNFVIGKADDEMGGAAMLAESARIKEEILSNVL